MTTDAPVLEALATLEATPLVLRALFGAVAEERVTTPADEDWSPLDVVAHLVTTELPFAERFRRIVEESEPTLPNIDERELLERLGERTLASLLDELGERRSRDMGTLRALAPEAWRRAATHELVGPVTLAELVCHKAYHDQLHLAQLAKMLGGPFDAARGAMQGF